VAERWRGTVSVTPHDRRELVVTDDALIVEDPTGQKPRVDLDLHALAGEGVLLVLDTTMTILPPGGGEDQRLQLRAFVPSTFTDIDWPPDVAERVEEQRARAKAASAALRRQLGKVVAVTITGLGVLLLVLVVVLLLR
jgi:hypothetical protein